MLGVGVLGILGVLNEDLCELDVRIWDVCCFGLLEHCMCGHFD